MVGTVVKNTGYIVRAWVFLYKEVVLLVFFYESDSWGGDRGHVKSNRGIPSLGSKNYYSNGGAAYDEHRVGVAPGGWRS